MSRIRLAALALFLAAGVTAAADPDTIRGDEQTLKAAKVGTDGPALLDFLRKRTITDASRARVQALIAQLGSDEFSLREKASADLVAYGPAAMAQLRQATNAEDLEVRRRAQACLRRIEDKDTGPSLLAAVARLLAVRRPLGAAEALLAFLPQAEDEWLAAEFRSALAAVAVRDGKPEPAVVKALTDKLAARRIGAAAALARLPEQRPAVRRLLQDADARVRLHVALGLVEAYDKEAVPILIALLAELPQEQGWRAEDALLHIAGAKAPSITLGKEDADRKKCRDTWAGWWKANEAKIDLTKLQPDGGFLGITVLTRFDPGNCNGRVTEIGPDGRQRWLIGGLADPIDVRVLPGNRVLIAEMNGHRVTERDFKGKIVWEKKINSPIVAQRLPDGNTLIATMSELVEVDREGKEVSHHRPSTGSIMGARKLAGGRIAYATISGDYILLDAAGKELRRTKIQACNTISAFEIMPDGSVLVPCGKSVKEYDALGKLVREVPVKHVTCVTRLPNGNLLVGSLNDQRAVEIDGQGKEVWEYRVPDRTWRARRR